MVFNNAYENKTILVTGHTGFKEYWLFLWLKHLGANVVGYSLDPEIKPCLFEILNLKDNLVDIRANIWETGEYILKGNNIHHEKHY